MGGLSLALQIITQLNIAAPGVAELILRMRTPDGKTVDISLNEAEAQFSANIKQADEWLKAHKGV